MEVPCFLVLLFWCALDAFRGQWWDGERLMAASGSGGLGKGGLGALQWLLTCSILLMAKHRAVSGFLSPADSPPCLVTLKAGHGGCCCQEQPALATVPEHVKGTRGLVSL